ncbi:TonB-dependent receptor [Caulobacter sp. 602-1]|nr:TonB-dependent receptor [Caulobacter sp. 602-1]
MEFNKGSARARLAKGVSRVALGIALSVCVTGVAMAQSQTGALRVAVTGPNGAPLAGATVVIKSPDSLSPKTATTDAEGRVRVGGLDPSTNYTVTISAGGYSNFSADHVAVVSGKDLSVGYALAAEGNTIEEVVITGRSLAAVDVTSATVGTTLTLQTVESLPTGRNYQSYLQLVPGVKPSSGGNPSSRSGVNYSDVGGAIGSSSDNLYYLDGVDVTDPVTGTFGANFNSEIIQEQQVIVGGVPAEYAGGSGLVSRVVTKSGSNEWHGSVNYYLQNDSLVAKDKHSTSGGYKTYDTAFTLGGPIIKDKLWVFGSYQKKHREDEVLNATTGATIRNVSRNEKYAFFKGTWQITDNDRLTGTFFNDPTKLSGQRDATILNNRDYSRKQGGDNYKVDYTHTWNDLRVNAYAFKHKSELTDIAVDSTIRDNVTFRTTAQSTLQQRSLGGRGINFEEHRDRKEYGLNFEYFLDTKLGTHTFKGGYVNTDNTYFQTDSVPGGVTYASIDKQYLGTTYGQYIGSGWTARAIASTDTAGFILPALNASASAKALLDTNGNGSISQTELNALVFNSTAGNPYGNVNVYRSVRAADAPYTVSSKGETLYLQDTWTIDRLTVNAGLRAEKWRHFASDGSRIAKFDWDIAPRVSTTYDVFGNGRTKVFAYVGRYYDPIRNDMSDFAGALTGPVNNEQIRVGNEWITFRTRGPGDAQFAPSTKTPYTDEFMIGASTTIGSSIGFSATVTRRISKDIMEDYDLTLYSNPNATAADGAPVDPDDGVTPVPGIAFPGSPLYLPYSYFGFSSAPTTNYVIGTLAGGKREYTGYEFVLTKYKTTNWFGQLSYTHNKAYGNSNSDGNADFQGDWLALDPRAPNIWGRQAGNIKHQVKAYGSYDFPFGLQVSSVFNWNSGSYYTPADVVSSRYLPPMGDVRPVGGINDTYVLPGFVGSGKNPSYYTLDARLKYVQKLPVGEAEFFLDVFNILDKQSPTGVVANRAGSGQYGFEQANGWVSSRRAYLGVRYSF